MDNIFEQIFGGTNSNPFRNLQMDIEDFLSDTPKTYKFNRNGLKGTIETKNNRVITADFSTEDDEINFIFHNEEDDSKLRLFINALKHFV